MPLRGIRGATTVEKNNSEIILKETEILLTELMRTNRIRIKDIAAIFFSVTKDLDATFPAKAARKLGLQHTALLCMNEIDVPKSMPHCIRILMHVNSKKTQEKIKHVYLKETIKLRDDLPEAEK